MDLDLGHKWLDCTLRTFGFIVTHLYFIRFIVRGIWIVEMLKWGKTLHFRIDDVLNWFGKSLPLGGLYSLLMCEWCQEVLYYRHLLNLE